MVIVIVTDNSYSRSCSSSNSIDYINCYENGRNLAVRDYNINIVTDTARYLSIISGSH